jgi:RecA-family ATPase
MSDDESKWKGDPLREAARVIDLMRERNKRAPLRHGFIIRNFGRDIRPEAVDWLWEGRVPFGALTLVQGPPDKGKTTFVSDVVARVTRGGAMPFEPGSSTPREPMTVLWFTNEESPSQHIAPRLIRAGANMENVDLLDFEPSKPNTWLTFPSCAERFDLLVRQHREAGNPVGLLVIDGLTSVLDRKLSANNEQDVRVAMATLSKVLEHLKLACIAIRHPNKNGAGSAINRGGGSIGFSAVARAEFVVGDDPECADARVLACVKANLTKRPPSLKFELVERDGGAVVEWRGESSARADDVYAAMEPQRKKRATASEVASAKESIMEALRDLGRAVPDTELMRQLEASAGVSRDAYIRAKQALLAERAIRASPAPEGWRVELHKHSAHGARRAPDEVF